ncbi:MAG: hypothetical protein K2J85_06590 [Anaeroplasmataceae bacterium]|nr:hypothetical protein [Anaeroplasmataceae bacterium]
MTESKNVWDDLENKKNKSKNWKKLGIPLVVICSFVAIFFISINIKASFFPNFNIIIFNNDKELLDAYNYAFIGKVNKKNSTKDYYGTGWPMLYKFYDIEVYHYLQGTGNDRETICFQGGKSNTTIARIPEFETLNNEPIVVGSVYLFFASKKSETSTDSRIGKNDFILFRNEQKILLNDYDTSKLYNEQNEIIQTHIARYQNVIDKVTSDKLNIAHFTKLEEKVAAYDYIAICKTGYAQMRTNQLSSIYPEIPQSTMEITNRISLKGKDLHTSNILRLVGVNYWPNEIHTGLTLPQEWQYYIVFSNIDSECDDIILLDDQQIIPLDDFKDTKEYIENNQTIQAIINVLKD